MRFRKTITTLILVCAVMLAALDFSGDYVRATETSGSDAGLVETAGSAETESKYGESDCTETCAETVNGTEITTAEKTTAGETVPGESSAGQSDDIPEDMIAEPAAAEETENSPEASVTAAPTGGAEAILAAADKIKNAAVVSEAEYTAEEFRCAGVINYNGYRFTYYSEKVLLGGGLAIPGRHVDENGYVCDENNFLCVASLDLPKGSVVETPLGKQGKVYDMCGAHGTLDVYVGW